jgi:mevalonate kinase
MVVNYKAHGKLLLTSEYAITQGAQGLAVPAKYGQNLNYISSDTNEYIRWEARGENGKTWFWVEFDLDFKIINTSDLRVASTLIKHLNIIRGKTAILDQPGVFTTTLDFPKEWGLGTSSTLMSLLAQCAEVDALSVFRVAHGGSGYDLACATAQTPIIYQLEGRTPVVKTASINFDFSDDIGFVYSGNKQLTSESLDLVEKKPFQQHQIKRFDDLTHAFLHSSSMLELEEVIIEHETLISEHLNIPKIKETILSGFPGQAKSLGGWGGDFVMVTRLNASKNWLRDHGFKVVFPFRDLIL